MVEEKSIVRVPPRRPSFKIIKRASGGYEHIPDPVYFSRIISILKKKIGYKDRQKQLDKARAVQKRRREEVKTKNAKAEEERRRLEKMDAEERRRHFESDYLRHQAMEIEFRKHGRNRD